MNSHYVEHPNHGNWRAAGFEAMPYTDDFPEALLVLPESFDGAIGQGNASQITISIAERSTTSYLIIVRDNGKGLINRTRFLNWTAAKAEDNYHRNGHGLKKFLTKYDKNWETAKWEIWTRRRGQNVVRYSGPFKGHDTREDEYEDDTTTLMPSGFEIRIEFEKSILKNKSGADYSDPHKLRTALRELICTRYSENTLSKTEFIIHIEHHSLSASLHESSRANKWHSFEWYLEEGVRQGYIVELTNACQEISYDTWKWSCKTYYINKDGRADYPLKNEFLTYGVRNQSGSRAHISLEDRMIEAMPIHTLAGRDAPHNDYNGQISIVRFMPLVDGDYESLPIPSTTKVSFYEKCPQFEKFKEDFGALIAPKLGLKAVNWVKDNYPQPAAHPQSPPSPTTPANPIVQTSTSRIATAPTIKPTPTPTAAPTPTPAPKPKLIVVRPTPTPTSTPAQTAPPTKLELWGISINLSTTQELLIQNGNYSYNVPNCKQHCRDSLIHKINSCETKNDASSFLRKWVKLYKNE